MTAVPRHRQTPVSIRSDKAAALLARLTKNGRSQAQVIEDALSKAADAAATLSSEEKIARIDAIVRPLHDRQYRSQKDIDGEIYDEFGAPR